jgi:hypothetical protein
MKKKHEGLFPWSEAQYRNFNEMHSAVKGFYKTPKIPEIAAVFPMKGNGLYDADNPVFAVPSSRDAHLNIKGICEDFERKDVLVCCWHNHVHANTFSPNDVFTLLSRPNLTAVVIDSDDRILVLHKTSATPALIDKCVDEYIGDTDRSRDDALRSIGIERVRQESVAARFFMTERKEYKERFDNMTVEEVMANIDMYAQLQEEIRQVSFAEFRQKCGTRYYAMLKNIENRFLYDEIIPGDAAIA